MTQEEKALESRLAGRVDMPISQILIGFEGFGEAVSEALKDSRYSAAYTEELVALRKDMMDMELRLRRIIDNKIQKEDAPVELTPSTQKAPCSASKALNLPSEESH